MGSMDALIEHIENAVQRADVTDVWRNRVGAAEVRKLYERKQRFSIQSPDAIRVPHDELCALTSEIRQRLGNFRSPTSDVVGNGLYSLTLTGSNASPRRPSVEAYAKILVLAAARIGAKRAAELLGEWTQGKRVRLSSCVLLKGALTDRSMQPVDGLRIETLSGNGDDLPRSLRLHPHEHWSEQFVRRAMLSLEFEWGPGLYDPDAVLGNPPHPPPPEVRNPELAGVSFESFCRALSLVTNNQIDWFISWADYGDVEAFFLNSGFSSQRKEANDSSTAWVSEEQVQECLRVHGWLGRRRDLDVPVARWRKSKCAGTTGEQLIELRIALESVFLSDDTGTSEKGHRLATRGAWLTGDTFEQRKRSHETLRAVYSYASSVIHGSNPRVKAGRNLGRDIAAAQDLCQKAILKFEASGVLNSEQWSKLILGGGALET